jgi:hypothetical protein
MRLRLEVWTGECPVCHELQSDIGVHLKVKHPEVVERLRSRARQRKMERQLMIMKMERERDWRDNGRVWEVCQQQ